MYFAEEIDNENNLDPIVLALQANYTVEMKSDFLGNVNAISEERQVLYPIMHCSNRGVEK